MNADNQPMLQISLSAMIHAGYMLWEKIYWQIVVGCPDIPENTQTILTVGIFVIFLLSSLKFIKQIS